MTEHLVFHHDRWHIAHPGAIFDQTIECAECDHGIKFRDHFSEECDVCAGTGRQRTELRIIRLAWFTRDNAFLCWDYEDPVVKELPDAA
jgi:hypothetical protein